MTPALAAVTQLAGAGLSLVAGTNVFDGPVRAAGAHVPSKAVFCLLTGGPPPLFQSGQAREVRRSTVQVRVRSEPGKFEAGETLARGCRDALQLARPEGFVAFVVRESEPIYLGADERGHHEWSLNLECTHET